MVQTIPELIASQACLDVRFIQNQLKDMRGIVTWSAENQTQV